MEQAETTVNEAVSSMGKFFKPAMDRLANAWSTIGNWFSGAEARKPDFDDSDAAQQ